MLVAIGSIAGCGEEPSSTPSASNSAAGASAAPSLTIAQVEAALIPALADLEAGDPNTYAALIDSDALMDRVVDGLDMNMEMRRGFASGIGDMSQRLGQQMVDVLQPDGSYRLLRVRVVDGQVRALARMLHAEGLNYHDIRFEADPSGKPRMVDMYVYVTGELISATMRRTVLPMIAHENRSVLQKLSGRESDYVKHYDDVLQIMAARRVGDVADVVRRYERLPQSVQEEKTLMLLYIVSVAGVDQAKYRDAMEQYASLFPNDPALWVMNIDRHFLAEDFKMAIQVVDKIDAHLGGDPYLNVVRANANIEMGNLTEARRLVDAALQAAPDLADTHWADADIAMLQGEFDRLAEVLITLEREFGYEFPDLRTVPEYAEFVKSPAYERWLAMRAN